MSGKAGIFIVLLAIIQTGCATRTIYVHILKEDACIIVAQKAAGTVDAEVLSYCDDSAFAQRYKSKKGPELDLDINARIK